LDGRVERLDVLQPLFVVREAGIVFKSGRSIASNTRIAIGCALAEMATARPSPVWYTFRGADDVERFPDRVSISSSCW